METMEEENEEITSAPEWHREASYPSVVSRSGSPGHKTQAVRHAVLPVYIINILCRAGALRNLVLSHDLAVKQIDDPIGVLRLWRLMRDHRHRRPCVV